MDVNGMNEKRVLLLCGTAETAQLINKITETGFEVLLSTATDASLEIHSDKNTVVRRYGRLNVDGFVKLINTESITAIVNACHPYASELRTTINKAAEYTGIPCFNYIRPGEVSLTDDNIIYAASHDAAAELAFSFKMPVLLTIGSNNLLPYIKAARSSNTLVIARVLPTTGSLNACFNSGLADHEIIAARGPFTIDENTATIKRYAIKVVVTKDSGKSGGFLEKINAAHLTDCTTIIVKRPEIENLQNIYSEIGPLINHLSSLSNKKSFSAPSLTEEFTHKHGGNLRELSDQSEIPIEQITDFSANINFIGPVPDLKEIILNTADKILHYPDPDYIELKNAISTFGKWDTEMIVPANGASELLYAAAVIAKKERAIIPVPAYNDYILAAKRASLIVNYLYLHDHLQFKLEASSLSDVIKSNDIVFLGRPNNPTGQNFDVDEMRSLITNNKNVLFIIDESFLEFSSDNISIAQSLPDNCIMIRSMTKFYSIPGLRLGYAVAHPDLASKISSMLTPWSINCIAQSVGILSLANSHYQMNSRIAIKNARKKFYDKLKSFPFLHVYPSDANFFLIKLQKPLCGSLLYVNLLKKGIAIRKCSNFIGLDDQYIRIAIRNDKDNNLFIEALEKYWKENDK